MNTDDSVDQIANNTSPFHFTETDTINTPAVGFTTPNFIALTTDQTTVKRYFTASQAELDLGFDSPIYKQIANYFSNENNVGQVLVTLFNPKQAAPTVAVTGVNLDKTTLSGKIGGTDKLTATVLPASATDKTVTYTSSDPNTVKVDSTSGAVNYVKAGPAKITAETHDGSFTATCAVTVSAK